MGFLFGVEPLLRRACPGRDEYRDAAFRHLGFFNTNPYMAGFVIGAVGALEERRASLPEGERPQLDRRIESAKKTAGAAVAAMGDSFFWGALRPACAAVAVLFALACWTGGASGPYTLLAGAAAYLVLYNAPAVWMRWRGLRTGYERPEDLPAELKRLQWRERARWVRWIGFASAALLAGGALLVPPWGGAWSWWNPVLLAAAIALRAAQVSTLRLYAAVAVLGAGAALAGF